MYSRPCYTPSGRLDLGRLPLSLLILVVTSAAVAVTFLGMTISGIYPAVGSVGAVLLSLIGGAWAAVWYGRWRNPAMSAALSLACSLIGYAGYYHLDQCVRWGAPWRAVDRLPQYITFRVATDQWDHQAGHTVLVALPMAPGVQPVAPVVNVAWLSTHGLHFAWELGIIALAGGVSGWFFATLPFSERRNCWMRSELCWIDAATTQSLLVALANRSIDQWAESRPRKTSYHPNHTKLLIWFMPAAAGEEFDVEAYIRVGSGPYYRLEPHEAAALVVLIPGIQQIAGATKETLAEEAKREIGAATARIELVPPPFAGRAVTSGTRQCADLVSEGVQFFIPVLGMLLTIGAVFALALLQQAGLVGPALDWAAIVLLLVGAVLSAFACRYTFDPKNGFVPRRQTRYERQRLTMAIASRTDALVQADDSRAIFVAMLPRQHWESQRSAPLGEFDHGLVRVDAERRQVLFEGDRERYVIPAAAILDWSLESLPPQVRDGMTPAGVVVRTRLGTGVWEFPFIPKGHAEENQRQTISLLGQIEAICESTSQTEFAGDGAKPQTAVSP